MAIDRGDVREQITAYVNTVVQNRFSDEKKNGGRRRRELQRDFASRGMALSGQYWSELATVYANEIERASWNAVTDLATEFQRQARSDPELFWSVAQESILEYGSREFCSAKATVESYMQTHGAVMPMAYQLFSQSSTNWRSRMQMFIREQRLRSRFQRFKSAEQRKAHGVPDVAVMMWFPDEKQEPCEAQNARDIYAAVCASVRECTQGRALVRKIDDPDVAPQNRISEAVEEWLRLSAVVICDLTGHRHNVYYEFGYARAIGTDVVVTCANSDKERIPFHLKQWPTIFYDSASQLQGSLTERLRQVLAVHDFQNGTGVDEQVEQVVHEISTR